MRKLLATIFLSAITSTTILGQEKTITGNSKVGSISIVRQPASLKITVQFQDANGNKAIDAEEEGSLEVTIDNQGSGKAYALNISAEPVRSVKDFNLETTVNKLQVLFPGKSSVMHFPWRTGEYLKDGRCVIRFKVDEKFNNVPAPKEISIETRALIPPDLQITDIGIDDDNQGESYGNSNGRIEKGESVEVEAIVQNRGHGEAGEVKVHVQSGNQNLFFLSKRSFALGDLGPGEYRKIKFAFTVPPNYQGAERLPLSLEITERRGRYGKNVPLALQINQLIKRTTELVAEKIEIKGRQRTKVNITDAPGLTVDVDVNIPTTSMRRPEAIAVIIGNRDYSGQDVPAVDYAIHDAAIMKEYFVKTLGYRPGNIIHLENATKAQFEATFGTAADHRGRLFSLIKPDKSEVSIYYSGHGAPDPESKQGYFVPVDCDPSLVRLNGYSLNTFYANLAKLKAKKMLVVIDACFSGVSAGGTLMRQISPVRIKIENPLMTIPNSAVFTSATGDQVSSWYAEKKHSLFTYFFLKGLSGEADKNSDSALTLQELADYVCDPNEGVSYWARRLHNREQTPTVIGAKQTRLIHY